MTFFFFTKKSVLLSLGLLFLSSTIASADSCWLSVYYNPPYISEACKAGFNAESTLCWENCPSRFSKCGGSMCVTDLSTCAGDNAAWAIDIHLHVGEYVAAGGFRPDREVSVYDDPDYILGSSDFPQLTLCTQFL